MTWLYRPGSLLSDTGGSWSAVSGPHGRGALPKGTYRIGAAVALDREAPNAYRDRAGFAWWCPITPSFSTDRTGLGIHPDGNVPGTEGCIGVTERDTRDAYEALRFAA